jgi:hypothetical protein
MELPLIAGVAGGVGATTLARAVYGIDCGIYPGGVVVDVLVARSTMYSLGCAQRAIAAAPERPILAVVADQPRTRLSSTARARLRMTEPHVMATIMIPYVPGWSASDDPHKAAEQVLRATELPKPERAFVAALHDLIDLLRPRLIARQHSSAPPDPTRAGLSTPGTAPHPVSAGWPDAY